MITNRFINGLLETKIIGENPTYWPTARTQNTEDSPNSYLYTDDCQMWTAIPDLLPFELESHITNFLPKLSSLMS